MRPAERVTHFVEGYCTHTKGHWAGVPFNLVDWQRDVINQTYGTLKPNGKRQYRIIYVEIPKKNGKSEFGAALALYGLLADNEFGAEVYSAAGDKEQASLVYYAAAQMVRSNKYLKNQLKVIDSRKRMVHLKSNSFYQVLSAESFTKHGLNPSVIIFDELHAQPNRDLWDVLTEGTDIARQQQLIIVITTAGIYDRESIGWQVHDYAVKVRDGVVKDPTFLPIIYAAEPKADWTDRKVWRTSNPSLGAIFDMENLRNHYNAVINDPVRINNFKRFRLNLWVNQLEQWIAPEEWDTCNKPVDADKLAGRECFGGLDLAQVSDLTSFTLVFPPIMSGERWKILNFNYCPEDSIKERSRRDRVLYDMWSQAGHITATPGNVTDYAYVRRDILKAAAKYNLREVAFDTWNAGQLSTQLYNEDGIEMVPMRQGFISMNQPSKDFYKFVKAKKLAHGGNPVLAWAVSNLVPETDAAENIKPSKKLAAEKIDPAVATIMALSRAILWYEEEPYKDEVMIL